MTATTTRAPRWAPYAFAGLVVLMLLIWAVATCQKPALPPEPTPVIDSVHVQPTPGRVADEAKIDSIAELQKP